MDFKKNSSFYLFKQNYWILGNSYCMSFNKFNTGFGYYLNPLANIWARYLLSFDNKATDYLAFSPKFLIMININNSNKDLEFLGSVL
jgi:hypothetical protein